MTIISKPCLLAVNAGSTSLKFALYQFADPQELSVAGEIDRVGQSDARLVVSDAGGADGGSSGPIIQARLGQIDQASAIDVLTDWLGKRVAPGALQAIGHRLVNGGPDIKQSRLIDDQLLAKLENLCGAAPEHMPTEIALVRRFGVVFAEVPQVACFDTVFHRQMPKVARMLSIPRKYFDQGIERLGFHGLSYAYLLEELERVAGTSVSHGKIIMAHIGGGVSLAALSEGRCVDTSMGFTPSGGVPMGQRSGDIDPGLVDYLAQSEGMSTDDFNRMINRESGLLGLSESSDDVRDLLEIEHKDQRAAQALEIYCYHIRKQIGAYAAALGGLECLIFTGGVGQNSCAIRARVCDNLGFLGIALDQDRNQENAAIISKPGAPVTVRVIGTDEECMIAKATFALLKNLAPVGKSTPKVTRKN